MFQIISFVVLCLMILAGCAISPTIRAVWKPNG